MSQKHSPTYTIVFVTIISLISASLLAFTAEALRQRIKENERIEVMSQILKSFQVIDEKTPRKEIPVIFDKRIKISIVDWAGKEKPLPDDLDISKLTPWKVDIETADLPVYFLKKEGSEDIEAYSIPIWGKGLWGPIYGYLALEQDARTIKGATFAAPKETPGLGAEIEKAAFREQWVGKTIFNDGGALTPIVVAKGKAANVTGNDAAKLAYHVDGITGATLTCKGVNDMLADGLLYYKAYLKTLKGGQK